MGSGHGEEEHCQQGRVWHRQGPGMAVGVETGTGGVRGDRHVQVEVRGQHRREGTGMLASSPSGTGTEQGGQLRETYG